MSGFMFGGLVGFLFASLLWALYLAFFRDDAASLGGRFRRWIRRKFNR